MNYCLQNYSLLKKIFAITLLVSFLFNQIGYYFLYNPGKAVNEKMEKYIFRSLGDEDCVLINYDENIEKITWQKYGTDFLMNGEEYDIAKTKNIGGKTYFYCITDTREGQLIQFISQQQHSNHPNQTDYVVNYLDEFILDTEPETATLKIIKQKTGALNDFLLTAVKKIILPPPRTAIS